MSRITIHRPHQLGLDAAKARAEQLAERLAKDYDVNYRWCGDALEFKRSGADGRIEVSDDSVAVELRLGLALSLMSSKIKSEIERTLDKSLQA